MGRGRRRVNDQATLNLSKRWTRLLPFILAAVLVLDAVASLLLVEYSYKAHASSWHEFTSHWDLGLLFERFADDLLVASILRLVA